MTKIEFTLRSEDYGGYPEPGPAHRFLPEWIKKMEQFVPDDGTSFPVHTAKRCVPFVEAMTTGYILPMPVTLRVLANEDGTTNFSWLDSSLDPIASHGSEQLPGVGEIYKFLSPWIIRLPKGYSALMTTPFNHRLPFQLFDGVVDLDTYTNEVNLPFVWLERPFDGLIKAGTPMAQIIPFKRTEWSHTYREATDEEILHSKRIEKRLSTTGVDGYREHFWTKKSYQ